MHTVAAAAAERLTALLGAQALATTPPAGDVTVLTAMHSVSEQPTLQEMQQR